MNEPTPEKPAVGVKVVTPAARATVPLAAPPTATMARVSPSTSVSPARSTASVNVTATSWLVEPVSSSATGASLTAVTLTVTWPVAVSVPSVTV